jgi:hypothetical protein
MLLPLIETQPLIIRPLAMKNGRPGLEGAGERLADGEEPRFPVLILSCFEIGNRPRQGPRTLA